MVLTDYMIRMLCAFLTGAAIGVERQYKQHNAGLRTNILVSIGAAAFTVISYSLTRGSGDPSRVAAQIVSGIGFLGGGLILKDGFNVRGLNTAATIWCSAACGTLSGVGMYAEAFILVACVLVTHCLFRPLCRFWEKQMSGTNNFSIKVECKKEMLENVRQLIDTTLAFNTDLKLQALYYKEHGEDVIVHCDLEIIGEHTVLLDLLVSRLRAKFGILNAGWERNSRLREDF